jgi:hypothetical protein
MSNSSSPPVFKEIAMSYFEDMFDDFLNGIERDDYEEVFKFPVSQPQAKQKKPKKRKIKRQP